MFRRLLLAAVIGLLPSQLLAEQITVETARGPVTLDARPKVTAIYEMSALDTLDTMGVEGLVSVNKTYIERLSQYRGDIGTLHEPDLEMLYATQPDLIMVGGRTSDKMEILSQIAPVIDVNIWGDDVVRQMHDRLAAYGELYGKRDKVTEINALLDQEFASTRAAVQGKGTALILLTNGAKISVYGAGGRFGWIHRELALPEAVAGLKDTQHGESVSFEFIRDANPDWILVLDRVAAIKGSGVGAKATLDNPLVADTNAAKKGQILFLNSADMYIAGGGVQSVLNTLALIKQAFGAAS